MNQYMKEHHNILKIGIILVIYVSIHRDQVACLKIVDGKFWLQVTPELEKVMTLTTP